MVKLNTEISGEYQSIQMEAAPKTEAETASQRETPVLYSVFFALFIAGVLGIFIANSGFFTVRSIVVQGNRVVPDEMIVLVTRISRNQNMFSLKRKLALQTILSNPFIAHANLRRVWPNRVVIQVVERKPVCLIRWKNNLYLMGNDRVILGAATEFDQTVLPVVGGVQIKNLQIGKKTKIASLDLALNILNQAGRELCPLISWLDVAQYRLRLKYPGNHHLVTVDLGNAEHLEEKMANLRAVLAENKAGEAIRIDLRVPEISTITTAPK